MAGLIDPLNDPGDMEALKQDLTEAVIGMEPAVEQEKDHTPADNRIGATQGSSPPVPKKYKGKELTDVIEMHRNLETAYGRMANDLGTQRKLTDELLELKRSGDLDKSTPVAATVSAEQLLDNPTQALNEYLDERDKAVAIATDERLKGMEQKLGQVAFAKAHPDYQTTARSQEFISYINSSPLRTRIAKEAGKGNWNAATELMDDFKRDNSVPGPSATAAAKAAAAKAGLTASSASTGKAGGGKKIYRRADLIQLKLTQPEVYSEATFQAEILAAYAEGRVK